MDAGGDIHECLGDEDEFAAETVVPSADAVDATGRPINQKSVANLLINAEVLMD